MPIHLSKKNYFPVLTGGDLWRELNEPEDWGLTETRGDCAKVLHDTTGDLALQVALMLQVISFNCPTGKIWQELPSKKKVCIFKANKILSELNDK